MNTKTKQRSSIVVYLFLAFTIGGILSFVAWLFYLDQYEGVSTSPTTFGGFGDKHYYAINPETILEALNRGEKNVFTAEIATPEKPTFEKNIAWHQADYLKIASVLNQFVWNDSLGDWNLYYMHFKTACQDNMTGLEVAEIAYFKTVPYGVIHKEYTVRGFEIVPQSGYVVSAGGANFPQQLFDKWSSVNSNELRIPAEDILKIAEDNGAQDARLSVQNQCTIHVSLSGNADWKVFIYDNTGSSIFRMEVDPSTGKIR